MEKFRGDPTYKNYLERHPDYLSALILRKQFIAIKELIPDYLRSHDKNLEITKMVKKAKAFVPELQANYDNHIQWGSIATTLQIPYEDEVADRIRILPVHVFFNLFAKDTSYMGSVIAPNTEQMRDDIAAVRQGYPSGVYSFMALSDSLHLPVASITDSYVRTAEGGIVAADEFGVPPSTRIYVNTEQFKQQKGFSEFADMFIQVPANGLSVTTLAMDKVLTSGSYENGKLEPPQLAVTIPFEAGGRKLKWQLGLETGPGTIPKRQTLEGSYIPSILATAKSVGISSQHNWNYKPIE